MTRERLELGRLGEDAAVKKIKSLGYKVLERNYRARSGEIDIIGVDGGVLVFIEVKSRSSTEFGTPGEAVGRRKQIHITRAAMEYLQSRGIEDSEVRFDVVSVLFEDGGLKRPSIEVIKGAFEGITS